MDLATKARSAESVEKAIWLKTRDLLEGLSRTMKRVKVEGASDSFAELQSTLVDLQAARDRTNREWRVLINAEKARADTYRAENTVGELIKLSESRVLGALTRETQPPPSVQLDGIMEALREVSVELGAQRVAIARINDRRNLVDTESRERKGPREEPREEDGQDGEPTNEWRDVVRRKPWSKKKTTIAEEQGKNGAAPKISENKDDGEEEPIEWTTAGRRRKTKVGFDLNVDQPVKGAASSDKRRFQSKTPAVLIKVQGSYADTLRAVRNADINIDELGAKVAAMRRTQSGDLIVELARGPDAAAATGTLRDKLSAALGGTTVTSLGQMVDVEVADLDGVSTKEEVLAALVEGLYGSETPPRESVTVTGLWATRGERQMATARIPASLASKLEFVRVGWLQCRVRPRRAQPLRCFRCHGFGHSSGTCRGPDLSACCRRCGVADHKEMDCAAGNDLCVACDRDGLPKIPHRTGSGACAARRAAENSAGWKVATTAR